MPSDAHPSRSRVAAVAVLSCLVAVAFAALVGAGPIGDRLTSPIMDDPGQYRVIADEILDGTLPYVDGAVEHLPGAVTAMVVIGALASLTGIGFSVLWVLAMSICVVGATMAFASGPSGDSDRASQFLVLGLPLLPIVLFRVEPWLILFVVLSLTASLRGAQAISAVTAAVATTIKGWPLILLAMPWRAGARRAATVAAGVSGALIAAVALSEGFRDARAYTGIHTETLVGSLALLVRHVAGGALELVPAAGAAYVEGDRWAVVLNGCEGVAAIAAAVWIGRDAERKALVRALGVATVGIVLASPLLSAQFIYWLVPFAVFFASRRARQLMIATGALTLAVVVAWSPTDAWWAAITLTRNLALVTLAVVWITTARRDRQLEASTSRRNLPV